MAARNSSGNRTASGGGRKRDRAGGASAATRAVTEAAGDTGRKRDRAGGASAGRPSPCPGLVLLWIVRIGISLVLMIPLIVKTDLFYPYVVGKALFARSIIEITFAFWAALVLFHRQHRPSPSWVMAAFAVWLLVSWIAAAFGVSPTRSLWSTYERMQGVFDLAHWFAFSLMAGSVFRRAADWRLLFSAALVFSTAVCAASLAHRYGLIAVDLLSGLFGRIGSTLGNPLDLGTYVMLNALIGVALFVHVFGPPAGPVVRRIGSGAAGGLCALMVFVNFWTMWLSGTRSAMAGLGAASLVFAGYAVWSGAVVARRTAAAVVVALIMSAVVLLAVARTTTILDPVIESSVMLGRLSNLSQDPYIRWRLAFAEAGLRAYLDRPVLGWGPENFLVAWGRYNSADTEVADHAHNALVEELTTKGVLGLLSYLAVWAVVMSVVFRSLGRLSGRDQLQRCLIGATLVACFVQNLFQVDTPVSMMHFSLLIAFAVSVEASGRTREFAGGADSSPRRANLRALLDRVGGGLTKPVRAGLVFFIAATVVALVHLNMRIYSAASTAAQAMATSRPLSERLDDFTRSIRGFPGLAAGPRYHLVSAAADLGDLSEEEFQRTVAIVAREVAHGSRADPQNWLLESSAAIFYQLATTRDRKYLDVARRHVDRAAELAPGVPLTISVVRIQEAVEAGGRAVLSRPE